MIIVKNTVLISLSISMVKRLAHWLTPCRHLWGPLFDPRVNVEKANLGIWSGVWVLVVLSLFPISITSALVTYFGISLTVMTDSETAQHTFFVITTAHPCIYFMPFSYRVHFTTLHLQRRDGETLLALYQHASMLSISSIADTLELVFLFSLGRLINLLRRNVKLN